MILPVQAGQDFWLVLPLPQTGRQFLPLELADENNTLQARSWLPVLRLRTFPDIKKDPARKDIEDLATLGLMTDYQGTGLFLPGRPVSRAELLVFLTRAAQLPWPSPDQKNLALGDVLPVHWAYAEISAAAKAGVIEPDALGKFLPDGLATRNDALIWSCRISRITPKPVQSFWDISEPYGQPGYLAAAYDAGLWLTGWQKNTFLPMGPITRAEAASLLARLDRVALEIKQLRAFDDGLEILPGPIADLTADDGQPWDWEVKVTQPQGWLDPGSVRLNFPASRRSLLPKTRIILPKGAVYTFSVKAPAAELSSAYITASDQSGRVKVLALAPLLRAARPQLAEETEPVDLSVPDLWLDLPPPVYYLAERPESFFGRPGAGVKTRNQVK